MQRIGSGAVVSGLWGATGEPLSEQMFPHELDPDDNAYEQALY